VNNVVGIGKGYIKPPRKIFGFTLCRHVWKKHWHSLDESTQVELERCTRCLRDRDKSMGKLV